MELAVAQAISPSNTSSLRQIARQFEVPLSTLAVKVKGRPGHSEGHLIQQKLSAEKEEGLVRHLGRLADQGWAGSLSLLHQLANGLVQARTEDPKQKVGIRWHLRFLKRHPELSTAWSSSVGSKRAEAGASGVLQPFLERLLSLRERYHVEAGDIYNMDEKGFVLGSGARIKVVVRSPSRETDRQRRTAGNRDFVTVVETVSTREVLDAPMVIFKAKRQAVEWAEGKIPTGKYFFFVRVHY